MQQGWVSLHRKIIHNPIYSNANMLKLWIHCLLKASHSEHEQLVGNQLIKLEKGQFITGRKSLYLEFNQGVKPKEIVSEATLFRYLKVFQSSKMLNIKTTSKYSVISILNWSEYQQSEQIMNSKRTADEQQMNTNNNVNKDNKKDMCENRTDFESWWNLYNNKKGKVKCEAKFQKLVKKFGYEIIEDGTKRYLDHLRGLAAKGEFVPQQKNPLTFLNGEHFNDVYETTQLQNKPVETTTTYKPFSYDKSRGED